MFKISIVEDDIDAKSILVKFLNQYAFENKFEIDIKTYSDGLEFINNYSSDTNIIFMDVDMPHVNGFRAAKKIRELDSNVSIVFTTVLAKYAIKGYEYDAIDYLVKPLKYESFSLKVKKVFDRSKDKKKNIIPISSTNGLKLVSITSINYIESNSHKITFHLDEEEFYTYSTLKKVEEELNDDRFYRCSNCCIINLAKVDSYDKAKIVIRGKEIFVSRDKKKDVVEHIVTYHDKEK